MKISISHETSLYIDDFAKDYSINDSLHNNVLTLYSLDAFIGALLFGDEIIAFTNIRAGFEDKPLIENHPEIPVTVVYPSRCEDELYKVQLAIAEEIKKEPEFISFYKKIVQESNALFIRDNDPPPYTDEYIDNTALITSGDIFRAINNNASFFANQIESPIVLIHQLQVERAFKNSPNFIRETIRKAWNENIHKATQVCATYFTANIPFFLNFILRECKTIEEIWKITMEYRNSNNVKKFRNWLNDMNKETDFKCVLKELNNIENITRDIFEEKNIFDSFALGFPPSISLPPITEIERVITGYKRHFRFYRRLLKDALKSARFENELQRVFNINKETSLNIVHKMSN